MAKKEKATRLFEDDLTITGKHATHLKFLVKDAKLFDDYIDVYMNAAVFGYLYSKKDEKDNESSDRARIYADAFSTHRMECVFLYRLITLLDDENITTEERLDRAFRYDANPDKEEDGKKWEAENPDWNKVVIIPVKAVRNSNNEIVEISNSLSMESAALKGGTNPANKLKMQIFYTTF